MHRYGPSITAPAVVAALIAIAPLGAARAATQIYTYTVEHPT